MPSTNTPRLLASLLEALSPARRDHLSVRFAAPPEWVDECSEADPSGGKYTPWVCQLRKAGNIRLPEDADKIRARLEQFQKLSRTSTWKAPRDILKYRTYTDLVRALEVAAPGKKQAVRIAKEEGMKLIASGPTQDGICALYEVTTPEAAAKHFRHTEWCVKDPQYYNDYGSPFYYIAIQNEDGTESPHHLLHFDEYQCTNSLDEPVPPTLFKEMGMDVEGMIVTPEDAVKYASEVVVGRWREKESLIVQKPEVAVNYVRSLVGLKSVDISDEFPGGRWPEGEEAILRYPSLVNDYMSLIVKIQDLEPNPELEAAILRSLARSPGDGDDNIPVERAALAVNAGGKWAICRGTRWVELEGAVDKWMNHFSFSYFLLWGGWGSYVARFMGEWPALEQWLESDTVLHGELKEDPYKVLRRYRKLGGSEAFWDRWIGHFALRVAKRLRANGESEVRMPIEHGTDLQLWDLLEGTAPEKAEVFGKVVGEALASLSS